MSHHTRARPAVTVHYAQTLDGRIATRSGSSQWISGDASLRLAHELRAEHEAVLVGVGTVIADNPRLTVRLVPGRSPLRVVADSTLRLPLDAALLTDGAAETLIATTSRAAEPRIERVRRLGGRVLVIEQDSTGRVDITALLRRLRDDGVRSLLIEGGGGVITSALRARVVDRLTVCIAPKLVGDGIQAVNDLNIPRMSDALCFSRSSFRSCGDDMIFDGLIQYAETAAVLVAGAD